MFYFACRVLCGARVKNQFVKLSRYDDAGKRVEKLLKFAFIVSGDRTPIIPHLCSSPTYRGQFPWPRTAKQSSSVVSQRPYQADNITVSGNVRTAWVLISMPEYPSDPSFPDRASFRTRCLVRGTQATYHVVQLVASLQRADGAHTKLRRSPCT